MYWSRVKTIMIVLFFAIDIMLISYIVITREKPETVSETVVTDVVEILKRSNLTISPSAIFRNVEKMGMVELDNLWADNDALAKLLLKTDTFSARQDNRYIFNNKQVSLFDDYLHYTDASLAGNIGEENGIDEVVTQLGTMGIPALRDTASREGNVFRFYQTVDGYPIFETSLGVQVAHGGIADVNGYWIITTKQNGIVKRQASALQPATAILINFSENPYYNHDGDSIYSITTGYTFGRIYRDTTHKLVSIFPAYKIAMENGDYYIYDAASGEFSYGFKNGQPVNLQ